MPVHRDLPSLTIEKADREMAATYAKLQAGTVGKVINKLMEGCFSQQYMATHSVYGSAPRHSKPDGTPPTPIKPGMEEEHISALYCKLTL